VVERSFADVLGVRAGDRITLDGRPFLVAGIAVTAALPFYPMEVPARYGSPARMPAALPPPRGLMPRQGSRSHPISC
jgi:putative ABC transport system permease protein